MMYEDYANGWNAAVGTILEWLDERLPDAVSYAPSSAMGYKPGDREACFRKASLLAALAESFPLEGT